MYNVAKHLDYTDDIIIASKHREVSTGKILSTTVPLGIKISSQPIIIIDDICDGGRTFIEIAKVIKKWDETDSCKIYLIVTHGIFSAGFKELGEYFDRIYTTNSIGDIPASSNFKGTDFNNSFIKQLNVF